MKNKKNKKKVVYLEDKGPIFYNAPRVGKERSFKVGGDAPGVKPFGRLR